MIARLRHSSVASAALAGLLLCAVSSLSSCGASESESNKLQIAVIPKGTTHEYWKAVHAGAERAAQDLDVEILWKGPLKEDDRAAQIQVVEDMVVRGVDGIVLVPLDRKALVAPAKEAKARDIPVVVADSDLDWEGRVSYVATDNYKGGELAAETLADLLDGEGRVIMLRYLEGSGSTTAREEGFMHKIGAFEGIEVISSNQYSGASGDSAYAAAENLLNSHADVDGVFCSTEGSVFGMLRALQDSDRAKDVTFVGFDASGPLVDALREGEIDALVLQDPVRMGELSVRACVAAARGEAVEPSIDTGVQVVRSSEIDDPAAEVLLQPDLSILER